MFKKPAELLALTLNSLKPKTVWVNSRNEGVLFFKKPDWPAGVGADWVEREMAPNARVVPCDGGWVVEWDKDVFKEEGAVCAVLCGLLESRQRVRLFYGKDGTVWPEENDVLGYIGRSTGKTPCYLLIHNSRSTGGPAISVGSIMGIRATSGEWLYKHPDFNVGTWDTVKDGFLFAVTHNGEIHAKHLLHDQATKLKCFMRGHRFSK